MLVLRLFTLKRVRPVLPPSSSPFLLSSLIPSSNLAPLLSRPSFLHHQVQWSASWLMWMQWQKSGISRLVGVKRESSYIPCFRLHGIKQETEYKEVFQVFENDHMLLR